MTIGIAAYGPSAGKAVTTAWAVAERIGNGAIGGFAVFIAVPEGAEPVILECQRGGLTGNFSHWVETDQWQAMLSATLAAVITSGPDRPLPLQQFLASSRTGLVTGHRLPNLPDDKGTPLNMAALKLIDAGMAPAEAVAQLAAANPKLDAGLVAVTHRGIGMANTAIVQNRTDTGQSLHQFPGFGIALLHNSINPSFGFAETVAQAGLTVLRRAA